MSVSDLTQQQAQRFVKKMHKVADARGIGASAMIAACLIILRNLYAVLPSDMRPSYCNSLRAFVTELEAQSPQVVTND